MKSKKAKEEFQLRYMRRNYWSAIFLLILVQMFSVASAQITLTKEQASSLVRLPLNCIQKKYPYKPEIVLNSDAESVPPFQLHPAFYGCFDWHSSVHGHWALVKFLKLFPGLPEKQEIIDKLKANLTTENIKKETEFFRIPNNSGFERTYGWAWLLKLEEELATWNVPEGKQLADILKPLADTIALKYLQFLPKLNHPIRVGEHTNTAFGMAFAWDFAKQSGNRLLLNLIEQRARDYYLKDMDCPFTWEPGGFDFLSPCLAEADLMTRVLDDREFETWFSKFLPALHHQSAVFTPAVVSDRTDPKLIHLDGLNFSRAWCLLHISEKLNQKNSVYFRTLAEKHLQASLPWLASGEYGGEHWLVSFALYALTCSELPAGKK